LTNTKITKSFRVYFRLSRLTWAAICENEGKYMTVNPKSLNNLKPGANKKNAVRVTLTLKPETVKLLRMTGNMSAAVDKFIELVKQGCVQHDGMLNPLPRSEPKNLQSQDAHTETEAIALTCRKEVPPPPVKPAYWSQVLTRKDMIERGFSAHKLDNMPCGTAVRDEYDGTLWWKESIGQYNENLRPLGSRANTAWCR
jgi:hypothetical protein